MQKNATHSRKRLQLPKGLQAFVALVLIAGTLAAGYRSTRVPVTVVVDGEVRRIFTQQSTVGALLLDASIEYDEATDLVAPDPGAAIDSDSEMTVYIRRARPVLVTADGQTVTVYTHGITPDVIIREAKVSLDAYDDLAVEGALGLTGPGATESDSLPHVIITRAVAFTVDDDGVETAYFTTESTVGEALLQAGVTLYLADNVEPPLGTPMADRLYVQIDRSIPVQVTVDGRIMRSRTHRERVDQVLGDLGVVLTGQDYTSPTLDSSLAADTTIRVVRVSERFEIEQEPIPFESVVQADPELEIDNTRLLQDGAPGILQRRIRIYYEDGQELSRSIENEYVAIPPTTKITGYGTQIVVRTLDTPRGAIEYWRVIPMLASSYSAGTAGTSPDSPWYGRTATGMQMRFGIVAVDPRMISLNTEVYVPGYGVGYAGDTGGAVKGRRIDLGYDDSNLVLWYRWVDVYLLTPVPASISYRLGS